MRFLGGIRYGRSYYMALNATWPVAGLFVEPEKLIMKTFWRTFCFEKNKIKELSKYSGFFSTGVLIEHSVEGEPPFIVFWTFSLEAVKASLLQSGYPFS